jgi:hypothetical protein
MADSLLPEDNQPSLTREDIIAKWKDKPREELEAAKAESDLYITTLTAKLDSISKDYIAIKEQQQTGTQLKELLDRLDNPKTPLVEHQPNVQTDTGIKPEDVEAMIAKKLTDHQLQLKQQDNFNSMQAKLKQNLGDEYSSAYKQRLDTLGLTKEFADDLARNHPTVFIKTFGLDEQRQTNTQSLPRSNVRQASFAPSTPKRDWNFYQEMKKTNPRMYLDPKITLQMHDDALALGDAFGMPEV